MYEQLEDILTLNAQYMERKMKNLLAKKTLSEQFAEGLGAITTETILILIGLIRIIAKLLFKFRKWEWRLVVVLFVLANLYTTFLRYASAPKADASQPFQEQVIVSLPMTVHPDLKLRDAVLSLARIEFGEDQVNALDSIVTHESGWDPNAVNRSSGACGLFQSLPCNKMHSMSIQDQVQFGFDYIKERYQTPSKAWTFWQAQSPHWY